MSKSTELGDAIRVWRARLSPADLDLPVAGQRRVPGLRREELALVAGISADYLVRIEQGRSSRPSSQVLASLARALRLNAGERELLYRAAGSAPPPGGEVPRDVPYGIRLMLDRLPDAPVAVFSAAWDLIEANALWRELFDAGAEADDASRNLIWRHFAEDPDGTVVRAPEAAAAFEREIVADLRRAADRYPDDRAVSELVDALRDDHPRFAELWSLYQVAGRAPGRKTVRHPDLGPITFDGHVLSVEGDDLRIVLCSAQPGTPDARAFAELHRRASSRAPVGG